MIWTRRVPILAVSLAMWTTAGCQDRPRQSVSQPASAPTAVPATQPDSTETSQPGVDEKPPKRPVPKWMIFRHAWDEKADASVKCDWTGGNRLKVETVNVRLLTLDLTKLPDEAQRRGPWVLQIDGQGIEITGRKGRVMDLARSRNGDWSVVENSHRARP